MMRDGLGMNIDPIWGTKWLGRELIVDNLTGKSKLTDINGSAQSPELRQSIIDQFMSGKNKVILVSLSAGGAGISLHDDRGIAPRQSLISPSYSAIDLVQAVGRIWRAGSKSKATQRIIYASKTIEEEIAASITAKINNIETLNDGDIKSNTLSKFTSI
jgi:SNF2 family DNA or RNA helicase